MKIFEINMRVRKLMRIEKNLAIITKTMKILKNQYENDENLETRENKNRFDKY